MRWLLLFLLLAVPADAQHGLFDTNASVAQFQGPLTTPTITGGTINGAVVGGTAPAPGTFSNLTIAGSDDMAGAWNAGTGTVQCTTGSFTTASATVNSKKFGRTVFVTVKVMITAVGTCTSGLIVHLPFGTLASLTTLAGREIAVNGAMVTGSTAPAADYINIQRYDNAFPASSGAVFVLSGILETAN